VVEQCPAEPLAGAGRVNRYLLNVQAAVDHVRNEEPNWAVVNAGDHPQPFGLCAGGKRLGRPKHPTNLGHADVVEHLPRCPVDPLNAGELPVAGQSKKHYAIVA